MIEILTIIAVAISAFIGTNLDNLILLVAMHKRYEQQTVIVSAGYLSGMFLIGIMSFVIGEAGDFIPVAYLGLLGLIPILIGVNAFSHVIRSSQTGETSPRVVDSGNRAVFLGVLVTQLSNSTDSIITFSLLLAESADTPDYLIEATFLTMACVFAWLALYALRHRRFTTFLGRYGNYITPFILILVGVYILSNTATDLLPG